MTLNATKKYSVLTLLLFLLVCYPVLKLNISSIIFIVFCVLSAFYAYKKGVYSFSKRTGILLMIATSFYISLFISSFYSEDIAYGLEKTMQLLPLALTPLVILIFRPQISALNRKRILNIFLFANGVFSLLLIGLFFIFQEEIVEAGVIGSSLLLNYDKIQFIFNEIIVDTYWDKLFFIHKAYFSMGFVLSSIFALQQATDNFKIRRKWSIAYGALFFYFSFLVIYTFSFPNVLALLLSLICFIWLKARRSELKFKSYILLAGLFVLLLILGVFYKFNDKGVQKGVNFVKAALYQESIEDNDARVEIYKSAANLWQTASLSEKFFGYGIGDVQASLHNDLTNRLKANQTKNILLFNEEFNSDYWFRNNIEVVQNAEFAPNLNRMADVLVEQNDNIIASHNISTEIHLDKAKSYTLSIYAKSKTASHLVLRFGTMTQYAVFNLNSGTIQTRGDSNVIASIQEAENDWYRCSLTISNNEQALVVLGISNENSDYNYKSSSRSIQLWGAQIEQASRPTNYVKNNFELIDLVIRKKLNTHNNYLFFLFSGGAICLLGFIVSLLFLLYLAIRNSNILQFTFAILLILNCLTENIFSRHWGLMFVAAVAFTIFNPTKQDECGREI
jgi:hypothetical protein